MNKLFLGFYSESLILILYGLYVLCKGDGCGSCLKRCDGLTGDYITSCMCVIISGIILDGLPGNTIFRFT